MDKWIKDRINNLPKEDRDKLIRELAEYQVLQNEIKMTRYRLVKLLKLKERLLKIANKKAEK